MEFKYICRSKEGQVQRGSIDSPSRREAIVALQNKGLIILELAEVGGGSALSQPITLFRRVKPKEMVAFSRQLSTLFAAKISLLESLRALARQSSNKYFTEIIFDVANEVEAGSLLSKAFAKHPKVFSGFFINMVRSGEVSGGLDRSLNYLAEYLEKQYYLNAKVRGAMIYPAFIFSGFLVVAVLLLILVVPQLTTFLVEAGGDLPLPTKLLIAVSKFVGGIGGLITLLVLIAMISAIIFFVNRSEEVRRVVDMIKIRLPVFKQIFQGIYLARMTDNLSTLIQGGLPILQALQITGEVIGNIVYRDIIFEAKENVRTGNSISSCFEKHKEIPPMVVQMVATGEQSGTLDEILKKMSLFYTKEVDNLVSTLSQLIEPVLLVIIGIGVAILVASIMIPIYNIASSL